MENSKTFLEIINEKLAVGNTRLPVFNENVLKVQQELVKEDPDTALIEKIIIRDQALTGQVLRQANSAFFRGLNEVSTIKEAVIRLGLNEVCKIVLMVAQKEIYTSDDAYINEIMARLWRHSQASAIGAQWLARECQFEHIENEAFFAGLLHDVGKLFILTVIEDLRSQEKMPFDPTRALIHETMQTLHTAQGYSLMKSWNLPDKYCAVARDHHDAEFDQNNFLLIIVRLANLAANKLGEGLTEDVTDVLAATAEANCLGLTEIDMARLEIALEDELQRFSQT